MRRSFWTPAVLGVVGGLVLLLSGAAGWVDSVAEREVGGVTLTEPVSTSGTTFAPAAVALGLGALVTGALLAVTRGRARRAAGVVVTVLGAVAVVVVVAGLLPAVAAEGTLTPAPIFAVLAAVTIATAGVAATAGPRRPPTASRYRVEGEQAGDDEWSLAADEEPPGT